MRATGGFSVQILYTLVKIYSVKTLDQCLKLNVHDKFVKMSTLSKQTLKISN